MYWQNMSAIASEIARSNDVFIKHNFDNHDGEVPVWAAVEVLSFGTLSKIIKNLKTGVESSYSILATNYQYISKKGNQHNGLYQILLAMKYLSKVDLTKHFVLKPVRLSAECYDKHFAIFIKMKNKLNLKLVYLEHLL